MKFFGTLSDYISEHFPVCCNQNILTCTCRHVLPWYLNLWTSHV